MKSTVMGSFFVDWNRGGARGELGGVIAPRRKMLAPHPKVKT